MKTKYPTHQNQQDLKRVAECLYRSQNSNIYYAILKRGGKKIQRSLKIPDGAMAPEPPKSESKVSRIENAKKAKEHACKNAGLPHLYAPPLEALFL